MAATGWTAEEAALARGETAPPSSAPREQEQEREREPIAEPQDDAGAPEADAGGQDTGDEDPRSPEALERRAAAAARARDSERSKRRDAERAAREAEHKLALANERINTIAVMMQQQQQQRQAPPQPAPKPQPVPSIDDDPRAYLLAVAQNQQALAENQRRIYAAQQQEYQQRQHQAQIAQARAQYDDYFAQDIARVSSEIPDVREGVIYLYNQRLAELADQGYTEAQARASIDHAYYNALHEWTQGGYSPAEALYVLARRRGYQPNGQQMMQQQPRGNGADFERVQRGQAAAASLSNVGGAAARPGRLTASSLADMPQRDFDAWLAKAGADGFREAMMRGR